MVESVLLKVEGRAMMRRPMSSGPCCSRCERGLEVVESQIVCRYSTVQSGLAFQLHHNGAVLSAAPPEGPSNIAADYAAGRKLEHRTKLLL